VEKVISLPGFEGVRLSRGRWTAIFTVVALTIWPLLSDNAFLVSIGTLVLITAVGAASLHLIIRTGHISLGHAGFAGIGAYTCTLTSMQLNIPFPISLILGGLLPAALALAIGPIVLRLSGKYFVLVTFLLGEIIRMAIIEWSSVTGGSTGIFGVPKPFPAIETPTQLYYFTLVIAVLCIGCISRILNSQVGRAIDSIRESQKVAECSGVPVLRLKVTIFSIACGFAGIQGALYAYHLNYIDPTGFSMIQSLNLLMMNVIGGMQSLVGTLIGVIFITATPELLRDYVLYQQIIFGIILIIIVAAFPGGFADIAGRIRALWRRGASEEGKP
jgi:branched-chain amino acid transport system permease protein